MVEHQAANPFVSFSDKSGGGSYQPICAQLHAAFVGTEHYGTGSKHMGVILEKEKD